MTHQSTAELHEQGFLVLSADESARCEAALQAERLSGSLGDTRKSFAIRLYDETTAMARPFLTSALFTSHRGPRAFYASWRTLETYQGAVLSHRGPELRQDDRRVLSFLVAAVKGRPVGEPLAFDALDFVTEMGWARHTSSVAKLDECLERMQTAIVKVERGTQRFSVQLMGWVRARDQRRTVYLHESIVGLFDAGHTYLKLAEYRQLTDGFATWLAGFLRASTDECTFDLADLHRLSGSTSTLRGFGDHIRDTMPKLLEAGVVGAFSFGRGVLKVAYDKAATTE